MLASARLWLQSPIGYFILTWLVIGLTTLIFKPRSKEEYAELAARRPTFLFTRVAAFWQLLGGLGVDPRKVAVAALKVITGRADRAPPPSSIFRFPEGDDKNSDDSGSHFRSSLAAAVRPAGILAGIVIVIALVAGALQGCTPQQARTAKDVTSEVLSVTQMLCIVANQELADARVAEVCGIAQPFFAPMQNVLAGERMKTAATRVEASQRHCWPASFTDAGAP